ncbi:MAG: hypothetical protein ACXAC8_11635 [Candidatus Hodarchaeales archaeon]|jgi:hypothetical protein
MAKTKTDDHLFDFNQYLHHDPQIPIANDTDTTKVQVTKNGKMMSNGGTVNIL